MTSAAPRVGNAIVVAGTALLGLGLAFSTAMVAVGEVLLALAFVLQWKASLAAKPWREPVMAAGLALLAWVVLRTLAADTSMAAVHRINQYQELLLAPLLLAVWRDARHRRLLFACFIAGCLYVALWLWASHSSEHAYELAQRQRISAGFALAIAAYLLVLRAPAGGRKWPHLAAAAFFAFTVVFGIDGRTGLVVLVLLAACAAWVLAPPNWRIVAAVGVPALLAGAALLSPAVQGRIDEMDAAWHSTAVPDEADSSGVRLQLLRINAEAVREHWLEGVGYSHYTQAHRAAAEAVYSGQPQGAVFLARFWSRLNNPHDEYVMQLVGGGIAGFVLFVAWLGAGLWQARRIHSPALAGLVLAFALGCVFNSMLLDFIEGHLFVGLMAWMVGESRWRVRGGIERILVVATRQTGDVLLATPLVHAARTRWPQARIDVIGFEGTLGMLRGNPEVDGLLEARAGSWGGFAFLRRIFRRYDLALVTDVGDRAHLVGWVAARQRSGVVPARHPSNWWKRLLLDHVVVSAGDHGAKHVAVEKQELLAPWVDGLPVAQVRAPEGAPLPADLAAQLRPGFVVVHAPSMWPYKQWPVEHFAKAVRELTAQGHQVVLTGTASARDQECIAPLRPIAGAVDASGRLDARQLVTLLQDAALYIGPDTSVSHLAAATGVPVIAIFGPTNPLRWAPRPAHAEDEPILVRSALMQQVGNVTIMQSTMECVPCARAGCEDHRHSRSDCLADIAPERVVAQALRLLGRH